jgi:ABC-type uncharacterized transport system ATPase subunit
MSTKISLGDLSDQISSVASKYGLPVDPSRHIYTMSVGERQRVEIIRALLQKPGLLILDEPTSVLTPQAVEKLFETLRQVAAEGCSLLYISHKLNEIQSLCDRATILRGGRVTGTCIPRQETPASIARLMIGADLPHVRMATASIAGQTRLEVANLSLATADPFGTVLADVNLKIAGGEILGIAGVSGNGQSELMSVLSGEQRLVNRGSIKLDGQEIAHLGPGERRALGLCSVPEDRLGQGSVPVVSLADNVLLTANRGGAIRAGMIQRGWIERYAQQCITSFDVRCSGSSAQAGSLSGGNLQKFIIGREILQDPVVLIVAQPTWGVDVGAATIIRQAIIDLRDGGAAILVISEELDELFEISDRIAVITEGRLSDGVPRDQTNRDRIGIAMTGGHGTPSLQPSGAPHAAAL